MTSATSAITPRRRSTSTRPRKASCGRRGTRSARSSRTRRRGKRARRRSPPPTEARRARAEFAEEGVDTSKLRGAVPPVGETVVMRSYTFTNYAGRFLYVEAHNKGHEPNNTGGPALQLSYAGPDGAVHDAGQRYAVRRRRPVHVPPLPGRAARRVRRRPDRRHRHPRRRGHGLQRHVDADRVGRQRAPAADRGVPEGLHHQVHGPDRGLRADRRARRGEPRRSPRWSTCRTTRSATSARRWR